MATNGHIGVSGRTRGQWEKLVEEFERSGLSRKRFCARASIAVSSLDYWRRRLRQEETPSTTGSFIELPAITSDAGWDVELELGGGVVLRVRRG